jgi:hypothetical protein
VGAADRRGRELGIRGSLGAAFRLNTKPWRSIFSRNPTGWNRRSRRRILQVLEDADRYVQDLNDRFTNPSGTPPLEATGGQVVASLEDSAEELPTPAAARAGGTD